MSDGHYEGEHPRFRDANWDFGDPECRVRAMRSRIDDAKLAMRPLVSADMDPLMREAWLEDLARAALNAPPIAPSGEGLLELAIRLTPNPARTAAGTLAVIIDGIDRLDTEKLARALGFVIAAQELECAPITDEQWAEADPAAKQQLILSAMALKNALRVMQ
jgi:hypothetical protein